MVRSNKLKPRLARSRSPSSHTISGRHYNFSTAAIAHDLDPSDDFSSGPSSPVNLAPVETLEQLIREMPQIPQLATSATEKREATTIYQLLSAVNNLQANQGNSLESLKLDDGFREEMAEFGSGRHKVAVESAVEFVTVENGNDNVVNGRSQPDDDNVVVSTMNVTVNNIDGSQECSIHIRQYAKTTPPCWKSLFASLPHIAGEYELIHFSIPDHLSCPDPPKEIFDEAKVFWKDYVVGFFLDSKHPNFDMHEVCRSAWRLHGQLRLSLINGMYYLKLSSTVEKQRILEAAPTIIRGKPFIVTPWNASVDRARDQILSIPVWAQFNNVPSALQPLIGLNWLACHIGKLKCFDANTVAKRNLIYARALIEVTPHKPLPTQLKVCIEDHLYLVDVSYKWKPEICSVCKSFGHVMEKCTATSDSIQAEKVPLPRPPPMIWVPKPKPVVPPTEHDGYENINAKVPTTGQNFGWDKTERVLTHSNTGMKHKLSEGTYHIQVDEGDAARKLVYQVEGEGLILAKDGEDGKNNAQLLHDTAWDRRQLYSESSPFYLFDLATHFVEAVQEVSPGDAVGD